MHQFILMDGLLLWLKFALIGTVIAVAGHRLSRSADGIADKTGLAKSWIGAILLATVTGLPELTISVTSVAFADAADLTMGDLLGACVANLAILGAVDFAWRGKSIYKEAKPGHVLSAALNLLGLAVLSVGFLLAGAGAGVPVLHAGLPPLLVIGLYVLGMRLLYRYERRSGTEATGDQKPAERASRTPLRSLVTRFTVAALFVVGAGALLPFVAKDIVAAMGWSTAFMGTLFLALVTTLPELAVTVAAIRMGSPDLAYGNILGSNLLNLGLIGVADLLYAKGPILPAVSRGHAFALPIVTLMIGLILVEATLARSVDRGRWAKASSAVLVLLLVLNAWLSYRFGS